MTTTLTGYGITVDWDGTEVVATGTNKATRVALAGQDHAAGPVRVPVADLVAVDLRAAGRLVNGNLILHTGDGRKVQLHFLRKHADGFTELAAELTGRLPT